MATIVNKYLDNADFLLSTAVFDNAALTIPAADGFYQQNGVYREQSGGVLLPGSSTCPSCSSDSEILRISGVSATELCCGSSSNFTAHFNTGDSFTDPSTTLMYSDSALTTLAQDGWYQVSGSNQYREQSSGVLQALATCPTCPTNEFYITGVRNNCVDFCIGSYIMSTSATTTNNNAYSDVSINDVISGPAITDGWYAYGPVQNTSTPNSVFRVFLLSSNEVTDIKFCLDGNCETL